MIKKFTKVLLGLLVAFSFFSCATTNVAKEEKATITKSDTEMFWTLKGTDKNGEESTLYVLGTFHAGDQRIFPFAEEIDKAWDESNRYASEIATQDYPTIMSESEKRQKESMAREKVRIQETGTTFLDSLSDEQLLCLIQLFGGGKVGEANVMNFSQFEPWVLLSGISVVPLMSSGLNPALGIDTQLTNRLFSEGKNSIGLDDLNLQLDIMEFGTWEQQLVMLQDSIDEIIEDFPGLIQETLDLYEAYLAADADALSVLMDAENEEATTDYEILLNNMVFTERNMDWAEQFANFLYEGGTTFIFAGCGHFVGPNSVFEHMRENGDLN